MPKLIVAASYFNKCIDWKGDNRLDLRDPNALRTRFGLKHADSIRNLFLTAFRECKVHCWLKVAYAHILSPDVVVACMRCFDSDLKSFVLCVCARTLTLHINSVAPHSGVMIISMSMSTAVLSSSPPLSLGMLWAG